MRQWTKFPISKTLVLELPNGDINKWEQVDVTIRKYVIKYELCYRTYTPVKDFTDWFDIRYHQLFFDTKEQALTWYKLYCEGN